MAKRAPTSDYYLEQEIQEAVRALITEAEDTTDPRIRESLMAAIEAVRDDGDIEKLFDVTKWRRTPVELDEFLYGNMYLGLHPSELYPGVKEALYELETGKYVEAVFKGAIGGGKSTTTNLSLLRELYKTSCLRNPQQTFGVQRNSSIVFTIQSVRLSTAKKAVFQEMGQYIQNSPYFTEIYPYDRRITSEMIFREQKVTILPVSSSDTGAISMNVIGGVLDEMNFMQKITKSKQDGADAQGEYDQAKNLYLNLSKRRRSRFMSRGKLPGILFLVSSSRYPDDFTEIKAAESTMCGGTDPSIYVFSKSLWDSKGRDKYSDGNFTVIMGNENRKSRILKENEAVPPGIDPDDVIEVPEDFRTEFEKDLDGSIRDLAGRTTLATHPFIKNRESVYNAMSLAEQYGYRNIFEIDNIDLSATEPVISEANIRTDIDQMRVCHVDLSINGDSAGVAIGHIAGNRTIQRYNPVTQEMSTEVLPVIAIDAALRVFPPPNSDIQFSSIRQVIYHLREHYGLPIKIVTTDGFQSVDFRQILAKKGYRTEYLSMDKTTQPYVSLRDALNDGCVLLPRHPYLLTELVQLELTRKGSKEKVDHPPKGSKDIADAVCGVVSFLLTRRSAWSTQPKYAGPNGYSMYGNRTVHDNIFLSAKPDDDGPTSGRKKVRRPPTVRSTVTSRKRLKRTINS